MHWWKKFLSNFFSDKTIDEQTEWNIENNNKNNHKNEQHEMKTRMIYQYPKGEFRFPLIKDQPGNSIPGKQKQQIQRQQKDERRTPEKKQNRQANRRPTEQIRRKVEPKNSQPFEPTHIPSPIYGFNRPIERKVSPKPPIPEFELNDIELKFRGGETEQETEKNEKLTKKTLLKDQPGKPEIDKFEKNKFESEQNDLVIKTWRQHSAREKLEEIPDILQTDSQEQSEAPEEDNSIDQMRAELDTIPNTAEEIDETAANQSSKSKKMAIEPIFNEEHENPEDLVNSALTEEIGETKKTLSSEASKETDEDFDELVNIDSPEEINEPENQLSSEESEETSESILTEETRVSTNSVSAEEIVGAKNRPHLQETEERIEPILTDEPEESAELENQFSSEESKRTFDLTGSKSEGSLTSDSIEEVGEPVNSLSSEVSKKMDAPVIIEDPTELANSASTEEISEMKKQIPSETKEASLDPVVIKEYDEITESVNPASVEETHETAAQLFTEELEIEGMAAKQSDPNIEPELIDDVPLDGMNEKLEETVSANTTSSTLELEAHEEVASTAEMTSDQETGAKESSSEESSVGESTKGSSDSKPRSNLPFNVLMLSQDKTNWKKQSERQKDRNEAVSTPIKEVEEAEPSISETVHYTFPDLSLLKPPVFKEENTEWLNEQTSLLDETMENFNVKARVVNASQGPSVTRFEVQPDKGVKVNKITNLSNDIKLSMAARDIRMEAPIPGTRSIGIELPNKESRPVQISEIIGERAFLKAESPLTAVLGLDISGEPVVTDLRKMPHGLIAGATGSGKSVCINSILVSLLYKARPDELKLMLIDPKMVELAPYNHIPHLVSPVITDVKAATAALKWAVDEMERRYELFVHAGVRDIGRFNVLAKTKGQKSEHLPYIVIIIDELADLMMVAPAEVEESICRIAQKARACGIHLLIATQRPSVDVITGLIKANVPTRIAFAVSSQVDSRTVIDVSGAEKLLGRGDMLFLNNGSVKPVRLQGTFVSDEEIDRVIDHVRDQGKPNYIFQQEELLKKAEIQENEDELFMDACQFVVKQGNASTSLLQRQFRIGYNRAARLMEMMEDQGVISGSKGSKPRDVLIKEAELDLLKDTLVH